MSGYMGAIGTMLGGAVGGPAGAAIGNGAAQLIGNAVQSFTGGKTGETVGGYNEGASSDLRDKAKKHNIDPATYARIAAEVNDSGADKQMGRDMNFGSFANQLNQSNQRAGTVNQMALNDQSIAAGNAQQLANAYGSAQANQANSSANMARAFMGR